MAHDAPLNPDRVDAARQFVVRTGKASPSAMARDIKTSVREADRMLDALETEGLVSARDRRGARVVLRR